MTEKRFNNLIHKHRHKIIPDISNTSLDKAIKILQDAKEEVLKKDGDPFDIRLDIYSDGDINLITAIQYISNISLEEIARENTFLQEQRELRFKQYLKLQEEFGDLNDT